MRDWKKLQYTDTYKELVDTANANSDNGAFIDSMVGTILCNGILFNGNETINGETILPLQKVNLSGAVTSDTVLDNFTLYFRDINKTIQLDQFPIDLLAFNDDKIHFLFIKSDLSYRVSDYMFGRADEILIGRFMITSNSLWNHFYIMAQRCGTPMYHAADEFYEVEGMYVKSPGGLELSQLSGNVQRSGIQFNDYNSPDIYEFHKLLSERVPLRYINELNEIDYAIDPVYEIITNRYMVYNMNKKLKSEAETYINTMFNQYYGIDMRANKTAEDLNLAIIAEESEEVKQELIDNFLVHINEIYSLSDKLYDLLGDEVLNSVRRAGLLSNKTALNDYIDANLRNISVITSNQATAIKNVASFMILQNVELCDNPLDLILNTIQDELNNITFDVGEIKAIEDGKFTIQRILWDIYDGSLIMQYGDKVFDTYDDAVAASELVEYPAPWGKTVYIPLAVIILKSGITSINNDEDTLIIDRRWTQVDQIQEGFVDYVARAKTEKILDLIDEIEGKMDLLKTQVEDSLEAQNEYIENRLLEQMTTVNNKLSTLETSVNNQLTAVNNKMLTYSDFTQTTSVNYSLSNGHGGYASTTLTSTLANYYPIGIVGYKSEGLNHYDPNHPTATGASICDLYMSSRSIGTCKVYVKTSVANNQNWTYSSYGTIYILWVKVKN